MSTTTTAATPEATGRSPRDRLLDAANELFYAEGVHTVGIDRVIERAGVAKATLYSTFGSKDELVRSYLLQRQEAWLARMTRELAARFTTPRERLVGVFDVLGDSVLSPTFRGCAFMNASAEARSGSPAEEASDQARAGRVAFFAQLAEEAGAADPDTLARQLVVLYDGATVGARFDRSAGPVRAAQDIAELLVDASGVAA